VPGFAQPVFILLVEAVKVFRSISQLPTGRTDTEYEKPLPPHSPFSLFT